MVNCDIWCDSYDLNAWGYSDWSLHSMDWDETITVIAIVFQFHEMKQIPVNSKIILLKKYSMYM